MFSITNTEHHNQRYNTVGDYQFEGNRTLISVSGMQNPDHEFLIALHELVEAYLTKKAGIPEADITNFDINCPDCDPGNHPEAPYHRQHLIATKIEKIMAEELNIDWNRYEEEIDTVMSSWRKDERQP